MLSLSSSTDPVNAPPATPTARRQGEAQLVQKVCGWIDLHLHEDISWERLVRISGVSAPNLQALFLRHLKTTPMMYIRARRLGPGAEPAAASAPSQFAKTP